MENKLKSIVYVTVNTANNKIYVGVHITENPYNFDGYYGCGITGTSCTCFKHPRTPFQHACKKYGLKYFRRYTLFVYDNYEEALKMEKLIVDEDFIKRPDTYNVAIGGGAGLVPSVEVPVYQYDLEGNFLKEYRSKSDAARKNNCNVMVIISASLYKSIAVNSYWSETKVMRLDVSEHVKKHEVTVYVYNNDGSFFTEFPSIIDFAKKVEVNQACVRRALKNRTKCGGYYVSPTKVERFEKPNKKRVKHSSYFQYDENGNFIKECTIAEIKEICGEKYKGFKNAVYEHYKCGGYYWHPEFHEKYPKTEKAHKMKIEQYDLDGNLVKTWDRYQDCAKEFSSLRLVLRGARKSTKGFFFKYATD